jgi:hypothetical protein
MTLRRPLENLILRKPIESLGYIPKHQETVNKYAQQLLTNYPLRTLGQSREAAGILSEESRASHIHVLGTTREGKSKFLEVLIRHDIDNGYGCTLLDPSDNGQTAYNLLRYCIKKGHKKVCLIDPHDIDLLPTINPLRWRGEPATDSVIQNLMESIRLLWGQSSFSDTPRIETYLSAVLTVLYNAKATIPDAQCFLVKENLAANTRREQLLHYTHSLDKSRMILEEVFHSRGQQLFLGEFKTSIRRLTPFFDYLPKHIYGSTAEPMNFQKMVADKWVILVNLDKTRVWGTAAQRLLGTLVINEIITAVSDLRASGWQGQHYLYLDEAGQFATRVLADIMAYKGKSGLWATVSHQFYNQFEDKYVLDAVENLCKIKVLFYTPNATDRNRMLRDMYTGELKDQAGDAHAFLKKQHAVIKIGKEPPATVRIADIPDITDISPAQLGEWKLKNIYQANPWYRSAEAIREEINNRFALRSTTAGTSAKDDRPARGSDEPKGATGKSSEQPKPSADTPKPKRKSVFDDIAGG